MVLPTKCNVTQFTEIRNCVILWNTFTMRGPLDVKKIYLIVISARNHSLVFYCIVLYFIVLEFIFKHLECGPRIRTAVIKIRFCCSCAEGSLLWAAGNFTPGQDILVLMLSPKIHHCVDSSLQLFSVLNRVNPIQLFSASLWLCP